MADEGVVGSTVDTAKRHPYLIVGGFVAVVLLLYVLSSGGGAKAKTQDFTFSYGPSDAQIAAGTAQQIATQQSQTAVSLANTTAATQTSIAQDYFGYLTNHSADLLTATVNANATASQIAGINTGAQITMNGQDNNAAIAASNNLLVGLINTNQTTTAHDMNGNATALAINQSNNAGALALAGANNTGALALAGANNAGALALAGVGYQTTLANNATALASQGIATQSSYAISANNNATAVSLAYQDASLKEYLANSQAFINTTNQSTIQGAMAIGLLPAGYTR